MAAVDVFYHHCMLDVGQSVEITGSEAHHIVTVRRMQVGDTLTLTNGQGEFSHCIIEDRDSGHVSIRCVSREVFVPLIPRITVVQALIKGDRADTVFDDLTQAGADRIIPWQAGRSVRKIDNKISTIHQRWMQIGVNAAKQSRRSWFPEITVPMSTSSLVATLPSLLQSPAQIIVLHEDAHQSLPQCLELSCKEICLIIGPEGGITDQELAVFDRMNAQCALLGGNILRSWLAGTIATAVVSAMSGRWEYRPPTAS